MSTAWSPADELASEEAALLREVRETGDAEAFAELYRRHYDAATRLALSLTRGRRPAAEDLVEEGFTSTFAALKAGAGPHVAMRPYLYAAVRNAAAALSKRESSTIDVDSFEPFDVPSVDDYSVIEESLDQTTIGGAFLGLPSSWQNALWFVEVEQLDVADAAPLLELTPNAVSSLLGRAREGLKRRYLQQHVAEPVRLDCRRISSKLGAYVRDGLTIKESTRVEKHLETCESCDAAVVSLRDIGAALRAVIFPATVGTSAAAALGAGLASASGAGAAQASTASPGGTGGSPSSAPAVGGAAAVGAAIMSVIGGAPVWAVGAVAAILVAGTAAFWVVPAIAGGADASSEQAESAEGDDSSSGGSGGGSGSSAPPATAPATTPSSSPAVPEDSSDPTAPPADDPAAPPTSPGRPPSGNPVVPPGSNSPGLPGPSTSTPPGTSPGSPDPTDDPGSTDDPTPTDDPGSTDDPTPTDGPDPTPTGTPGHCDGGSWPWPWDECD
ncbi:hypothetical protein F8O01_10760 [Pseudoclavibacter chungangensis]|uniref:Sigma-70 family RNA polymerase sigma factor n=1 Tax=Pseudoclavibacter chungangensis TaxID=587635 RepID=A0A7J5BQR2_9MICO|nr:sigma-70 family RNA polymerase sigma factor [Pseudoclavibacter chungangensis]KAB1656339.1 hypothetical protein F8O01_10760 [Pseudoclavibacter chungangensis]NYJ67108.1 RNA polymerase sigma factor (sigma-70 family) [Pseudoclavibacter chungangensis]